MTSIGELQIDPALINSSCAWASSYEDLEALYNCSAIGAVTSRTATLEGFNENLNHTVAFTSQYYSSINSYGYSPHPITLYVAWIQKILESDPGGDKPFIISVAASKSSSLYEILSVVSPLHKNFPNRIALELNTSCPNIEGTTPLGYDFEALWQLLQIFRDAPTGLTIGLKLPPYTYAAQFSTLLKIAVGAAPERISFLTCTNTLGSSLLFAEQTSTRSPDSDFAVPTALGGLAGELLHPLALGNVHSFKTLLEAGQHDISVIGVGGVTNAQAALRMRKAGAAIVGCATLLGKEGVNGFIHLLNEMDRMEKK